MIREFYDTNKRTQTEQVLKNMEDIADLQQVDEDLDDKIDEEIQNRTDADSDLAYDIADLQSQLDSLGNVFTLKGSVATYSDLPATDNHIGDVWYVVAEAVGYVWIDDNGTERWEQLGLPIDLSDYVTTSDLALALDDYQPKLTAGTNISIIGDTISATQPDTSKFELLSGVSAPSTSTAGAVGQKYLDTTKNDVYICTAVTDNGDDTYSYTWLLEGGAGKQNKLTAGTNITISGDVISASGGLHLYSHKVRIESSWNVYDEEDPNTQTGVAEIHINMYIVSNESSQFTIDNVFNNNAQINVLAILKDTDDTITDYVQSSNAYIKTENNVVYLIYEGVVDNLGFDGVNQTIEHDYRYGSDDLQLGDIIVNVTSFNDEVQSL